ncbi:MAG: ATP-grasp domain-containing protein [Treponema sp.]|nr:ATP-grasp domain-containing protein [Treponema sp.]
MNEKYILILGAGLMQRPAIEAARELGYKTLVVDGNPSAVCAVYADKFEPVDLKDREGLAKLALSMKSELAGVFTAGTDFSASVSYVAEKCGFVAHSFEAALNASDKTLMRSCFRKDSVSSPEFLRISRNDIVSYLKPEVFSKITYPKVVKPVDNMGARGCRLIRNEKEFLFSVEEAVRYSRTGTAILEDYMDGPEFSIDSVVYDGTLTITGFADRHIYYSPYFIEMGHTMPTLASIEDKYSLIKTFANGIKSLGLTAGVAKADIKMTKNGAMIGEIAARLSGGYMSGWTYPYASSFNLTKAAMLISLGKEPSDLIKNRVPLDIPDCPFKVYEVPCNKTSAERAWISIPGKISNIYNLAKAECEPFVKNIFPRVTKNDSVDFPRNNVEKCGNVITVSEDYGLAVHAAENAVSSIVIRLEPNIASTDDFLDGKCKMFEDLFPPDAFEISSSLLSDIENFSKLNPVIAKNLSVASFIFESRSKLADKLRECIVKDYNYRTIEKTLNLFDSICPEHPNFNTEIFMKRLIRGGIQGILYYNDCIQNK